MQKDRHLLTRSIFYAAFACLLQVVLILAAQAAPATFEQAKVEARQYVYLDRNTVGTFYCGCEWGWTGRSGGRINFDSCGYEIRAQPAWQFVYPDPPDRPADEGAEAGCVSLDGQVNLTDEQSRSMPVSGVGFEQAYNAQVS